MEPQDRGGTCSLGGTCIFNGTTADLAGQQDVATYIVAVPPGYRLVTKNVISIV